MSQQFTPVQSFPFVSVKNNQVNTDGEVISTPKSFVFGLEHKILEFQSSAVSQEWKLGFSGLKERISSIAYVPSQSMKQALSGGKTSQPMKRARKFLNSLESIVVCGTEDSKILMWHENRLKAEWNVPSGAKIIAISSLPDKNGNILVLTDASSEALYSINLFADSENSLKNVTNTYQKLLVRGESISALSSFMYDDATHVAFGTQTGSIYITNLDTMELTHTLMGHSSAVNRIATFQEYIATASETEQFVNIYNLASKNNRPYKTLATPREVSSIDITTQRIDSSKSKKNKDRSAHVIHVAAVCESNEALVWTFNNNDEGKLASYHHLCHVSLKKVKGFLLAVALSNLGPELSAVYGSTTNPMMVSFDFTKQSHYKLQNVSQAQKGDLEKAALSAEPTIDMKSVKVTGGRTGVDIDQSWADLRGGEVSLKSLENKLEEMVAPSEGGQFHRKSALPTFNISQSLQQLVRARRFNDQRMLDIIDISDVDTIHSAVKSISEDDVFAFFTFLHNTLMDHALEFWRLENLYLWINSMMINHPSILQRVKSLDKVLSNAIHSVERKANTYMEMIEVSGRLDLLLNTAGHKIAGFEPSKDEGVQRAKTIDASITIEDEDIDFESSHNDRLFDDEGSDEDEMEELNLVAGN